MSFFGKMKAVTFSYDDGIIQDKRLAEIFDSYGMKCTFNLNSGVMTEESAWECNGKPTHRMKADDLPEIYKGHEVACHFLTHPHPFALTDDELDFEISEDIKNLETIFGQKIIGAAYPYGEYDKRVKTALMNNGIKYCRTVWDTEGFAPQTNLLEFRPTCHHDNERIFELAKQFVEAETKEPMLFYVWGHSYELDGYDHWKHIERLCEYLSGRNDIFYGANAQCLGVALS